MLTLGGFGRIITSNGPLSGSEAGLSLLWVEDDVVLNHDGIETPLGRQEMTVVDRSRPWALKSAYAWTAQLLEFESRSFLLRIGRHRRELARPIGRTLPLAQIIKRLWVIGREIEGLGVEPEVIPQRLIDIIGKLIASSLPCHRTSNPVY